MLRFLMVALALTITGQAKAQEGYSVGVNPYYGAVFRYKSNMKQIKFTHLHGLEFFLHKQTSGKRTWESKFNYPKLGAALSYYNYGEPAELGSVYSATGYIDFNLSKRRDHGFRINVGSGLVYSDVIYDKDKNPENKAIGAHLSYVLRGTVYYHYQVNNQWNLNINAAFRHYSNGRTNMPNNGMNFPLIGVGLEYTPQRVTISKEADDEAIDRKLHFNLFAGTAWREVLMEDQKHKAYTLSAYLSKRITWYNAITLGFDGFYYSPASVHRDLHLDGKDFTLEEIDGRMAAVQVGNELYFGKLRLLVQIGFYVYDKYDLWKGYYQRYGLKYHFVDPAFVQVSLKSHTRTANMIEWGLGLSL